MNFVAGNFQICCIFRCWNSCSILVFGVWELTRSNLDRAEEEAERLREDGSGSPPNPLLLSCCDPNTEATTQYLTSKLVRDSLRWQRENAAPDGGGGPSEQACASPRRCMRLPKSDRVSHIRTIFLNDHLRVRPSGKVGFLDNP